MLPNLIFQRASPAADCRVRTRTGCRLRSGARRGLSSGINFGSTPAKCDRTCPVSFDGYRRACSWPFSLLLARVPLCMSLPRSLGINWSVGDMETGARTRCAALTRRNPSHLGPRRKFLRCSANVHGSGGMRDETLRHDARGCTNEPQ